MINRTGPYQRGETISVLALGDPSLITGMPTAWLKPTGGKLAVPPDSIPKAADFTVTPFAGDAAAGFGPGWTLTLTASQTGTLDPGLYVCDFRAVVGGGVYISDPLFIQIDNRVTG